MICGHCKREDAGVTVQHVRTCDGRQAFAPTEEAKTNKVTRQRSQFAELNSARDRVPAGRFALQRDGVWKFYKVDKPSEGRWEGYTFLKVQAGDDYHNVRMANELAILLAIGNDPRQATIDYGHQLGRCGICGRTLTNEESIAAGIGPVCAKQMGW